MKSDPEEEKEGRRR